MGWFERIKRFYEMELWTIDMVADGVRTRNITEEEFEIITGLNYQEYLDGLQ